MKQTQARRRRGFTLLDVLCIGGCLSMLFAVAAPAVVKSRSAARGRQCKNNLKQLGLAMHNYHDTFNCFPPGWVSHHRLHGKCYGYGWMSSILPFVEQIQVYNRLNYQIPLPKANKLLQTKIAYYRCPVDPAPDVNTLRGNYGTSSYSGNYGFAVPGKGGGTKPVSLKQWIAPVRSLNWPGQLPPPKTTNGMFFINSCVRIRDVIDGTSNTLLIGERSARSGAGIWPGVRGNELASDQLTDCSAGNEINSRFSSFSSYHPGGAIFLLTDGSTRFISENVNSKPGTIMNGRFQGVGIFQALSSRNGGEVVGE